MRQLAIVVALGTLKMRGSKMHDWKMRKKGKYGTPQVFLKEVLHAYISQAPYRKTSNKRPTAFIRTLAYMGLC